MASVKMKPLPSFWDTSWSPCQLNQEACLDLEKITSSFSAPISEEQAWAIVFECIKCLAAIVRAKVRARVFIVTNTQQILLHRDGRVHESTFLNDYEPSSEASSVASKSKFIPHLFVSLMVFIR